MKAEKKWIMSAFMSLMMVAIVGCGSNNNAGSENAAVEKIKFATDASYAPMEFMDTDKIKGFDIDFIKVVMEEAGIDYDVTNTGWDTMLTSVKQGTEYQAGLSSVSITDERKETYDYSIPYFESTNMILVKEDSDIQNALDLKDKIVAIQGATTADDLMSGIMGVDNGNLRRFDSNAVALMELDAGGADAVVADIAIVREYVKNNPDKKFKTITDMENFGSEYYGILYPKGSEWKAKLDPAIKAVLENGKYAEIYKTWFGEEPNLENVLNAK
ncbi:transporter substrate-binding domain-containing protein [Paenibacillus donghaensis]|uniref:Basic amino acid ABC transporter substrate-binding protein n=1 Tax=Paenibacillus donghaensis TaxID=414771 RepID=A0A2Z2KVI4_9BACL|nr:transporter substrate-binding domain-containing protein [Paenibacillus donghaensis]ASA25271.1 basic amino acid ABC transporter substrate-binding protein [Paenibacillus donghaensis]